MILHAYALGIRMFDTGPSYGAGEAERRLGEALARLPPYDPIVTTKVGVHSSGIKRRERDFSPDAVRRSVDGSLKRLRRARIDCLYLHGPAETELTDKLLRVLGDLRSEGRVVSVGICGRGAELEAAMRTGEFTHFMAPVHAGLKSAAKERLYQLRAAGELVGIEVMTTANPRFPLPVSAGATWRLARAVMGWSPDRAATPMTPAEALCWGLNDGGAHRVITTTSSIAHLEANVWAVNNCGGGGLISG